MNEQLNKVSKVIDISNLMTDTKRLDYIERNHWEIESPDGENNTWVIYGPHAKLGVGLGCSKYLRQAIDLAIEKYETNLVEKTIKV